MTIRTPSDLGGLIRDKRIKMGLNQAALAQRVGVSRKWIVEMEQGKPRAAIGFAFRTLRVLGVSLELRDATQTGKKRRNRGSLPAIDIDKHLESLRRKPSPIMKLS